MPLIIEIKVVPNAGQQKCILDKSGHLKCYVKSLPEDGRANKELIKMLAQLLKISQAEVSIVAGATSRKKKIKIASDMTREQFLDALGLEVQSALL